VPSPRHRMAARLYASGALPSKRSAALAMGLSPSSLYLMTAPGIQNPGMRRIEDDIDAKIHDQTVQTSSVLQLIGREAILKLRGLMRGASSEGLQFKAAQDLADRSPETSKTIKAAIISAPLDSKDAKELAIAMVQAANARRTYASQVEGDFVRVDLGKPADLGILDKPAESPHE